MKLHSTGRVRRAVSGAALTGARDAPMPVTLASFPTYFLFQRNDRSRNEQRCGYVVLRRAASVCITNADEERRRSAALG